MSRRDRKQAIKQKEEILSLFLGSELRRVQQEYLSRTADQPVRDQRKYGGGLSIRKAGIFFNALGEPPPTSEISLAHPVAGIVEEADEGVGDHAGVATTT